MICPKYAWKSEWQITHISIIFEKRKKSTTNKQTNNVYFQTIPKTNKNVLSIQMQIHAVILSRSTDLGKLPQWNERQHNRKHQPNKSTKRKLLGIHSRDNGKNSINKDSSTNNSRFPLILK